MHKTDAVILFPILSLFMFILIFILLSYLAWTTEHSILTCFFVSSCSLYISLECYSPNFLVLLLRAWSMMAFPCTSNIWFSRWFDQWIISRNSLWHFCVKAVIAGCIILYTPFPLMQWGERKQWNCACVSLDPWCLWWTEPFYRLTG